MSETPDPVRTAASKYAAAMRWGTTTEQNDALRELTRERLRRQIEQAAPHLTLRDRLALASVLSGADQRMPGYGGGPTVLRATVHLADGSRGEVPADSAWLTVPPPCGAAIGKAASCDLPYRHSGPHEGSRR